MVYSIEYHASLFADLVAKNEMDHILQICDKKNDFVVIDFGILRSLYNKMGMRYYIIIIVVTLLVACTGKRGEGRNSKIVGKEEVIEKNNETMEYVAFAVTDFIVRIEVLPDGRYKYSSWRKPKTTKDTPDLVLYNGKMECWDEQGMCACDGTYDDGTSSVLGRRYIFENHEYTYRLEYGWWKGQFRQDFSIHRGKNCVLIEEVNILP